MVMASKTGKKAANAAEKARKTHKPDASKRKLLACHRKLLAKNERKAKHRAARAGAALKASDAAHPAQGDSYEIAA